MGGITKIKSLLLFAAFLLIFIGTTAETQARLDLFETFGSDFFTCDHFSNSLFGIHDRLEEKYGLSFEVLYWVIEKLFSESHFLAISRFKTISTSGYSSPFTKSQYSLDV